MRRQFTVTMAITMDTPDNEPGDGMDAAWRAITATTPHPDSKIATDRAGESVTVLVTKVEVSKAE